MNILVVRPERRFLIVHPSTAWLSKEPAIDRFGPTWPEVTRPVSQRHPMIQVSRLNAHDEFRSQNSRRHMFAISERMVLDSLQEMLA
jgi:hypothetical protein